MISVAPKLWSRRSMLIALGIAIVLIVSVSLKLRRRTTPALLPVLVFPDSYNFPSPPISLFARVVPPTPAWAWLWHLKATLFGKIKPLSLNADLITLSQTFTPTLGRPEFDGPGSLGVSELRVWLIPARDLEALRLQLKTNREVTFLNSPRVTTGDGISASVYSGSTTVANGITNETGIRVSYFPRVHPEAVDLCASFLFSDAVTNATLLPLTQTNLDVKARFQIPKGKGLFLLQSFPRLTNQNPMAVILSPKF